VNPSGGSYSQYADQFVQAITAWAVKDALWGISNLMHSFGDSTEPDFVALVPIYNRVLAISLLILGAVIAFGIVERIFGGQLGIGLAVVPRVVACVFFAYSGLAIVQYATVHAALFGHAWDRELSAASPNAVVSAGSVDVSQVHLNVVALIIMALLISFLALVVYLELMVRAALVLTISLRSSGLRAGHLASNGRWLHPPVRIRYWIAPFQVRDRHCVRGRPIAVAAGHARRST